MKERRTYKRSNRCELVQLTVSFNIRNDRERWLLENADRLPNFSGEMKRIFEESLKTIQAPTPAVAPAWFPPTPAAAPEQEAAEDFNPLEAFL